MLDDIPDPKEMTVTKVFGGGVMSDNCNRANATQTRLETLVIDIGKEKGYTTEQMIIYQGNCSNHARNSVMDKVVVFLANRLTNDLKEGTFYPLVPLSYCYTLTFCMLLPHADLDKIPSQFRVSCNMNDILYQVDKCANDTANYYKGCGDQYKDYKKTFHPTDRSLPKIRVTGGNRQDSAFEGALPVFDDRHVLLEFLDGRLSAGSENLLEQCLCMILESVEMIAQLRVCSILFLSIVVPWRWLAGKTHTLAHRNWGER
jgi:hypothetical protein